MTRLIFTLIGIFAVSCNSNKPVFEENPPFIVQEAFYQYWLAGVQEAGRGIHIELQFSEIGHGVEVENIYFRGQKHNLIQDKNNPKTFRVSYTFPQKEDVILDSDSVKEMDNPRPALDNEIPFQLKPDEAVIAYTKGGKTVHFKLLLNKREAVAYPSSKRVDNN
jgi:hypothetical protein